MAHPNHLTGLSLATKSSAIGDCVAANASQTVPEVHRDATVIRVAHHFPKFPVLDQLTVFTAELELVAVVINRPGSVGACLLYTSPSPRDRQKSRMPSSA